MILNQPDGSTVKQEEPDTRAQMDALAEQLTKLEVASDFYRRPFPMVDGTAYVNIAPTDFEQIRAIVREEVRATKGKSNESATALDGWKGNLQSWEHHGMTYRGYSLTELDAMIDFYRMHHIEARS